MTQLTENFHLHEFACPERHGFEVEPVPGKYIANVRRLCSDILQPLRDHVSSPISILSGYRTEKYNSYVGGVRRSQHLTGRAADIRVRGWPTPDVHLLILRLRKLGVIEIGGLGLYPGFVHVDIRKGNRLAHWAGSSMRERMRANVKATR